MSFLSFFFHCCNFLSFCHFCHFCLFVGREGTGGKGREGDGRGCEGRGGELRGGEVKMLHTDPPTKRVLEEHLLHEIIVLVHLKLAFMFFYNFKLSYHFGLNVYVFPPKNV